MASSRAALWAAAVDGGFSKGEAFVSQMPDGKNPENPGFSWALVAAARRERAGYAVPGTRRAGLLLPLGLFLVALSAHRYARQISFSICTFLILFFAFLILFFSFLILFFAFLILFLYFSSLFFSSKAEEKEKKKKRQREHLYGGREEGEPATLGPRDEGDFFGYEGVCLG